VSLEITPAPPAPRAQPLPLPEVGRFRSLLDFYGTAARTSMIRQFQYRIAQYFYMFGMLAEPVIYLVVWSTIARQNGGSVDGLTPEDFAAYYIVWTLVRQMNIVFTPYGWEWRIREGQIAGQLLKPLHPLHYDIADIAGWKVAVIIMWLPIAVVLTLLFHPNLHPTGLEIAVFSVAIWGAYLVRTMNLWLLGLITFWTTRVAAIFELYFVFELLLSGRLVPLQLMPEWVQTVANFLPFKWTFGYPIEALTGNLSTGALFAGLGAQALWTAIGYGAVALVWRRAVRRFTSVGN
jgi:viologen exporter family transport system permease protein